MKPGSLYLLPTPLGEMPASMVLPGHNLEIVRRLRYFIAEDPRSARRFLKAAGIDFPLESINIGVLNEHTRKEEHSPLLEPLMSGQDAGLLSEAGLPCVADPGAELVRLAHARGIRIIPLTGPSSLTLALMASGFNGQRFVFHGYLPVEPRARSRKIREMESAASKRDETQIFIETPYRNLQLFKSILTVCQPGTMLSIATDITLPGEHITTLSIEAWKQENPDLHKRPAVFLIYR
jgi:16S rRNA (cytidine1402-2'-O)-methyltransferase